VDGRGAYRVCVGNVTCKVDGRGAYRVSVGQQEDREDLGVFGRIILKLIINKLV
jgi:hypothetical protein